MAVIFYPKSTVVLQRDTSGYPNYPLFEQLTLQEHPNTIMYFGPGGELEPWAGATIFITSSWAESASWAPGGVPSFTGKINYNVPCWYNNTLTDTSSIWANNTLAGIGSGSWTPTAVLHVSSSSSTPTRLFQVSTPSHPELFFVTASVSPRVSISGSLRLDMGASSSALILSPNTGSINFLNDSGTPLGIKAGSLLVNSSYTINAPPNGIFCSGHFTGSVVSASTVIIQSNEILDNSISSKTANYTLTNLDDGMILAFSSSAGLNVIVSGSGTSALRNCFNCTLYQSGSGQLTFVTQSGTLLRNRSGHTKSAGLYAMTTLLRINNAEFVLAGDTGN